jgi:hypothetical protein
MAETVGSIVDKMSIIELKIFHMGLQTQRQDATKDHIEACHRKLAIMQEQKNDLTAELTDLLNAVAAGRRTIKVYRQFKMYNDPIYK